MIKRILLKLSSLVFCLSLLLINETNASWVDSASINNNQFKTGDWTPPIVYSVGSGCPEGTSRSSSPLYSLTISGNDPDGQTASLSKGETYILEASGTYQHTPGDSRKVADPAYTSLDGWGNLYSEMGIFETAAYRGVTSLLADLGRGVGIVPWGDFQTSHQYSVSYKPNTNINAQFLVSDWYGDWYDHRCQNQACISNNEGSLTLDIYICVDSQESDGSDSGGGQGGSQNPSPSPSPSPSPNPSPDNTPPTTTLTVDAGLVVDEKVEDNNGFETSGSVPGWKERNEVSLTGAEFEMSPREGTQSAKIGHSLDDYDYGNQVWLNGLGQTIDPGAKNLSFYYNFYTYDYPYDQPGFSVFIDQRPVFDLWAVDVWDYFLGYDFIADTVNSDWQKAYIDLTQFQSNSLGISFYAGNTNGYGDFDDDGLDDYDFQSWVYLDEVTTTEVVANGGTTFYLQADDDHDNDPTVFYQVDGEGEHQASSFNLGDHDSWDYDVYYWAVDDSSNSEFPNLVKVHLDKEAPDEIDDLSVNMTYSSSVSLVWTAPVDEFGEGNEVRAGSYKIKYQPVISGDCSAFDWSSAIEVEVPPVPRFPGEDQFFEVKDLDSETNYCLAVQTCDAALNCSPVSEPVFAVTDPIDEGLIVEAGDVVINELMWMGSDLEGITDEWIELRNMRDYDIDLSDWQLIKRKSAGGEECMYTFPTGTVIRANDYLVVSEYDSDNSAININCPSSKCLENTGNATLFALSNDNLQIKLYNGNPFDANGQLVPGRADLIDVAGDGGDPFFKDEFSEKGHYYSLERDKEPNESGTDGTNPVNWHICEDALTTVEYWDGDSTAQGTPGGQNRSKNELKVDFERSDDGKSVSFKVFNTADWQNLEYEITYDSDQGTQGILGTIEIKGENIITRESLKLGTCSSEGDICTYHTGIEKLKLKIILGVGQEQKIIEKNL